MLDDLELYVNGRAYRGWTEISLTRAMDAIAGGFSIALTERWAGGTGVAPQLTPWPILNGDACEIKLGGESILNGYIDQFRPSFGFNDHTIEIQGRDKTGDLVDCSAFHKPDQWANLNLLQIAKILCDPFGVKVRSEIDVGPAFPSIKIQQGETVFAALDRLARFRKAIIGPDGAGGIAITRVGTSRAAVVLVQGVNIKEASGVLDTSGRFSIYVVKGQNVKSKTLDGEAETHAEASITDSAVTRYRPLVVVAESGATALAVKERAIWEANVRLGRSATAKFTVAGWRQKPGGTLWMPNQLVAVDAPWLRMKGDMLIRAVTYRRTPSEGTVADLEVVSPQAFSPEPPDKADKIKRQKDKNIWKEALGVDSPAS